MNKIIFSEGGQPVFLDDLETLQGNSFDMWKAMLGEMTMGAEAFLLRDVTATRGEGNEVTVGSGILVIDGMCCEFSGQTLTASTDDTIYLVVSRVEEDMRVFDDGQERNCSVTYKVTITTDVTGASKYYPLEGLRTFLDLLSDALEANRTRNYPNVEFFNEYSGTVKLARSINKDDWELIVDIKSSSLIWDRQIPGYKGILFKISDEEAKALLQKTGEIKGEKAPRLKQSFVVGEQVKIIEGAFDSFTGTIEEVNIEKNKLRVMVGIFGRTTPVEVDFLQVEKI